MPGINGLEVCRRQRARKDSPYVYIILLTGMGERQNLLEGLDAGVDDYVLKPVDLPVLQARLAVGRRILDMQSRLMAAHEELSFQARHDPLTGLANRAAVLESLEEELARGRRRNEPVGLLVADLDHFKRINDVHGHLAGDRALAEAARRISSSVRSYDSAGRFGGEEFLIVLPGCDAATAGQQAERIRQRISRELLDLSSVQLELTVSIGAASTSHPGLNGASALIHAADTALYQAKRAGRNQVQVYEGRPAHEDALPQVAADSGGLRSLLACIPAPA
jgi:diguanylate cyclase (GGDEF)-like protein